MSSGKPTENPNRVGVENAIQKILAQLVKGEIERTKEEAGGIIRRDGGRDLAIADFAASIADAVYLDADKKANALADDLGRTMNHLSVAESKASAAENQLFLVASAFAKILGMLPGLLDLAAGRWTEDNLTYEAKKEEYEKVRVAVETARIQALAIIECVPLVGKTAATPAASSEKAEGAKGGFVLHASRYKQPIEETCDSLNAALEQAWEWHRPRIEMYGWSYAYCVQIEDPEGNVIVGEARLQELLQERWEKEKIQGQQVVLSENHRAA